MNTKAPRQIVITPLIVLSKIIELTSKPRATKMVRIDTLALIFAKPPVEMITLLQQLEIHGNVRCHIPPVTTRRTNNVGSVELLDYIADGKIEQQ